MGADMDFNRTWILSMSDMDRIATLLYKKAEASPVDSVEAPLCKDIARRISMQFRDYIVQERGTDNGK